ncbi:MAG TPA: zinc ribbon domain-containing protein [Casimicrobiaceae bacterium]|nr:zinc ribbon domain-containing protein [Casimicrobiaceae bacterium]
MPIYEYRCASCGHELEALQKLSDAPLTECPACHKPELQKLVSAAGFQLKGSGWYVTDFRNSGGKPAAKTASDKPADAAASAGASGADAGSAGKTESPSGDGKSTETKPSAGATATTTKATGTTSGSGGGS